MHHVECVLVSADVARTPDGELLQGWGPEYRAARHLIATGTDPTAILSFRWEDGRSSTTGPAAAYARRGYSAAVEPAHGRWAPHPNSQDATSRVCVAPPAPSEAPEVGKEVQNLATPPGVPPCTISTGE